MKTYWDYTNKERSEMSEQEVSAFMDAELMSKGVLKVLAPTLRSITPINIPTSVYFQVGNVVFKDVTQAEAFLKLSPARENYDYNVGYEFKYAELLETEIKQVRYYSRQDLLTLKSELSKNNESKKHNDSVQIEYEKAIKKVNDVTNGVWEDWYDQRRTAERHQKLRDTEADYIKLTNGDVDIARTFLLKVYSQEQINETYAWFGLAIPFPQEAIAAV